jgi:hypothetical protein
MGSTTYSSTGKSAMGVVDDDGTIRWAVVYDNYESGGSVQMHIAITDPKYVTRRAISAVFEYPFYQLGVKKVLGFVNSENLKALSFDLLSMTREKCRWLRGKEDGFSFKSTAAA